MPWFAAAAPFIGAGLSAAGTLQQSQGQQQAAAASAGANEYNAAVEAENARIALEQGNAQAEIDRQSAARRRGEATAAIGASGVDAGSTTPLAVMSDLATQGELTQQLTQYRARLAALSSEQRAGYDIYAAKTGLQAGQTASSASILTGATRLAGSANFGGGRTPSDPYPYSAGQVPEF